jgi:hypothetical protein
MPDFGVEVLSVCGLSSEPLPRDDIAAALWPSHLLVAESPVEIDGQIFTF